MTHEERFHFIDRELKGLWPQWAPTDAELSVWASELAGIPYDRARRAVRACFRQQTANYQRPVLSRFLKEVRSQTRAGPDARREPSDPTTNVFIECLQAPAHRPYLAGVRKPVFPDRRDEPDTIRACAESMRVKFEQLYGGHWIVVTTKPCPDDGLRGEPARRRAYEQILAGPDTSGRRFLENHLAGQVEMTGPAGWVPPAILCDEALAT